MGPTQHQLQPLRDVEMRQRWFSVKCTASGGVVFELSFDMSYNSIMLAGILEILIKNMKLKSHIIDNGVQIHLSQAGVVFYSLQTQQLVHFEPDQRVYCGYVQTFGLIFNLLPLGLSCPRTTLPLALCSQMFCSVLLAALNKANKPQARCVRSPAALVRFAADAPSVESLTFPPESAYRNFPQIFGL
ncbi:hypothetical protein EVAR_64302_1 [Eumeta japonica]|uniref:Uncharacterized protein n=1 Tax=Eumeta variegata TaxID=151549 RepID=A0A4C1ZPD6_EUMVA|nr:hypothetical protein EVAR_64302_1 [Eumeta japonica]